MAPACWKHRGPRSNPRVSEVEREEHIWNRQRHQRGLQVIDIVTGKKALGIAQKIFDFLRERDGAATKRFLDGRDEQSFEWVAELAARDRERLSELEALAEQVAELTGAIQQLIEDPQFYRVRRNYGYEAAREAIDERRRMLAYAAAGSISPNLTIQQLARVERTIRELDPSAIALLSELAQSEPRHVDPKRAGVATYNRVVGDDPDAEALIASGCVRIHEAGGFYDVLPSARVSQVGQWVLEVLSAYLRSTKPTEETPRPKAPAGRL